MNRRVFAPLLLLLCSILIPAGTASADPRPLSPAVASAMIAVNLVSPSDNSLLSGPYILFTWQDAGTAKYKLLIQSDDGLQTIGIKFKAANIWCSAGTCEYDFYPEEHQWKWRSGIVYHWSLKALNADGTVIGKSLKFDFAMNLTLPAAIQTTSPSESAVLTSTYAISFKWEPDPLLDEYRLLLRKVGGVQQSTSWIARTSICSELCTASWNVQDTGNGAYTWKVVGRRIGVAGKTKSAKMHLTMNVP